MATAPQNPTRRTARAIGAFPTHAPSAPRTARKISEAAETIHGSDGPSTRRADSETPRRSRCRLDRARRQFTGQAKLVAQMAIERVVRGELRGDLLGEWTVEPALLVDLGQFFELEFGIGREFEGFLGDIGFFGVALRANRHIFARRHRHGARDQPRGAGHENRRARCARSGDPGDQAGGRHDPVVGAEDRGAQPTNAACGVGFTVHLCPLIL